MSEVWKDIADYEGYYEVSDQGRVKSLARLHGGRGTRYADRILKPMMFAGYGAVALSKDGIRNARKVHHLVLETFVGPRPAGMVCCHGNDIRTDNRLANLRWDTESANQYDSVRNGRHSNSQKTRCRNDHPLAGDNLYVTPDSHRACRECNRQAVRDYKLRQLSKVDANA